MRIVRTATVFVHDATDVEFQTEARAVAMFMGPPATDEVSDDSKCVRTLRWVDTPMGNLNMHHMSRPESAS